MQEMFEFEWIFDYLSLGTTFLYRYYLAPPMIDDRKIEAAEEEEDNLNELMWRTTWERAQRTLDNFDAAYPDLVPAERLCIPGHRPKHSWDGTDSRDEEDGRRRIQILELEKPAASQQVLSSKANEQPRSRNVCGDAAITLASCSLGVSSQPHQLGEVHIEDGVPSSSTVAESESPCLSDSNDMIAGQPIIELESTAEESAEEEAPSIFEIEEEDNDLLRELRRDGRNLVLDSLHPHLAPHIVITPPEYFWDDYFIPFQNRVDPQWSGYLMVPPLTWHAPSSSHEPRSKSTFRNSESILDVGSGSASEDDDEGYDSGPWRVFSHEEFAESVEMASHEKLILLDVVTALQRHQCKANAFHASKLAPSFRRRYDSPDFVASLDQPFKWSDPAEPIFFAYRRFPGITIIDSLTPFAVPHIMISESPPHNPWTLWGNSINNPQDCQWGACLTVPGKFVTVLNSPQSESWSTDSESEDSGSDYADEAEHVELADCLALQGTRSRTESPTPATPTAIEYPVNLYHDEATQEEGREFANFLEDSSSTDSEEALPCAKTSRVDYVYDEDEDDLPPFDEWYTSVLERTQTA